MCLRGVQRAQMLGRREETNSAKQYEEESDTVTMNGHPGILGARFFLPLNA